MLSVSPAQYKDTDVRCLSEGYDRPLLSGLPRPRRNKSQKAEETGLRPDSEPPSAPLRLIRTSTSILTFVTGKRLSRKYAHSVAQHDAH